MRPRFSDLSLQETVRPRPSRSRLGGLVLTVAVVVGCTSVAPPQVGPTDEAAAEQAWSRVLAQHVDEQGRIDFAAVAADPGDLETYVAWLAEAPLLDDPGAHLAELINAYNALAMYNVLRFDVPDELDSAKVKFFGLTRFEVGGRQISLNALENEVIRPLGEERIHFALNCMVRGCPRLPREPFRRDALDAQLERQTREFLREERNVQLDLERRVVRFSDILRFYTEDFLAVAPSLIAYANRYREDEIPVGWEVEFIPYDWEVNRQP